MGDTPKPPDQRPEDRPVDSTLQRRRNEILHEVQLRTIREGGGRDRFGWSIPEEPRVYDDGNGDLSSHRSRLPKFLAQWETRHKNALAFLSIAIPVLLALFAAAFPGTVRIVLVAVFWPTQGYANSGVKPHKC